MADAEDRELVQREKRSLRRRLLSVLENDRLAAASVGCAALAHLELDERWREAPSVALFAGTKGEPDTRPILASLTKAGRLALFPRCIDGDRLEFAPVEYWDELRPGRYGLAEPASRATPGRWQTGDIVLVPGVAFDRDGGRLGRGRGYYDRTFANSSQAEPWLLGFAFELQVVERVPMGSFDRWLDGIVTESGIQWFRGA